MHVQRLLLWSQQFYLNDRRAKRKHDFPSRGPQRSPAYKLAGLVLGAASSSCYMPSLRPRGAQLCKRFASDGLKVVVAGRTKSAIEAVASEIASSGGQAIPFVGDATREADIVALFDCAGPEFELAIYNAGRPAAVEHQCRRTVVRTHGQHGFETSARKLTVAIFGQPGRAIDDLKNGLARIYIPGSSLWENQRRGRRRARTNALTERLPAGNYERLG
jgi:hypothetical protein